MDISQEVMQHINESMDYLELVDKLVAPQTQDLDKLISEIVEVINQPDYTISDAFLQYYYVKLTTELYMMVDKLKRFEIYSSLAKANEGEAYNNSYLEESVVERAKKPTMEELKIRASSRSKKESLVSTVYSSAFKTIKNKIDSGTAVADTLKNIMKVKSNIDFTSNRAESLGGI